MKHFVLLLAIILITVFGSGAFGQVTPDSAALQPKSPPALTDSTKINQQQTIKADVHAKPKNWYEKISLRGYVQVRYNRLLETNQDLNCEQCDKSWGRNGGIFIRRARLVISGYVHNRVYLYLQPDFASAASSSSLNFAQMRDAYFDLGLDKDNEFRVRLGQSKIPFGFENLQSSQNRIPLDRADPTNSGMANERDMAALFYWAPTKIRKRFSTLVSSGLKGSGDYGVVGFGVFNGQTANRPEGNNGLHVVGRVSYPFELKNGQFIEPGIQAYSGEYVVGSYQMSSKTVAEKSYQDERVAGSLVIYPQPFGLQMEYNVGRGPEFNPQTGKIESKSLEGGYIMGMYKMEFDGQTIIPFTRAQYYKGGKKHELDARKHRVRELEIGVEWQPVPAFELVAMYTISDRRFEDFALPENSQNGRLLRLQAQINY